MKSFAFFLALLGVVQAGVAASGTLQITVKDPAGSPISALVDVKSFGGKAVATAATITGERQFTGVAEGSYLVAVEKEGFHRFQTSVRIQEGRTTTLEVTLQIAAPGFALDVVGATPIPGIDRLAEEVPMAVQHLSGREIDRTPGLLLTDLFNRQLQGVYLNEIQGNPAQPDLNYRGYTASPLLGTPQGLSVYLDGVRMNQPFGDVVSWDLIPRGAIAEATLVPGSNPVFGLNTLGGAFALQTKDGIRHPGTTLQFLGGSFGRTVTDVARGGSNNRGWHYFAAAHLFFEEGWRDNSPSNVRQFLAKVGKQTNQQAVTLTASFANNLLNGNGLQEYRLLQQNYRSVYTKPDITGNRSPFLNLNYFRAVNTRLTFSGNAYYRFLHGKSFNGDMNEEALEEALYQPGAAERAALASVGITNVPASGLSAANTPFPSLRCIANALLRDEPAEKCNGLLTRGRSKMHNYGFTGQMNWLTGTGRVTNQLTLGAGLDGSSLAFRQMAELGYLNPDRSVTGVAAFGDGRTGGEIDGEPFDTQVHLTGKVRTSSFWLSNALRVGPKFSLTAAGRFNQTRLENLDRILPSGPGSLSGNHVFRRFNPSVGATYQATGTVNLYANYAEASRAPTSIELGCADPQNPCKLPNAMAGDPPLNQVVTRTVEAGVRGGFGRRWRWNAGYFRSENRDDLLFVLAEQTGFGYFKNFGQTRRQGLEFDTTLRMGKVLLGAGYTLLDATFQSEEEVNGESNSSNEEAQEGEKGVDGAIAISPGDRIPMTPRHAAKFFGEWQPVKRLTLDLNVVAIGSSFARGNENNQHQPDGPYYLGEGSAPRYTVTNVAARYQVSETVQLFVQVNNLFDRKFYSAAQLGLTGFLPNGNFVARPFPVRDGEYPQTHSTFFAPGAPRAAFAGVRFHF